MAQARALSKVDDPRYENAVMTLELDQLTPRTLGALMSMFEHKVAILGILYGINAFDQPGVEFGKKLCRDIILSTIQKNID